MVCLFNNQIINMLNDISGIVSNMGQNSGLLSDLNTWNSTLAGYSQAVNDSIVKPIAYTVLVLFILLELYNATQRIAASPGSSTYGIIQVGQVMIKFVMCKLAVDYSTAVVGAIFAVTGQITAGIAGYVGGGEVNAALDVDALVAGLESGIGAQLSAFSSLLIATFILHLLNIVVNTIVAARFIELYVFSAMAALPITTLCNQELHGVGVNFLKSYTAVSLQGALLYLVIGFFPALFSALGTGGGDITSQAWGMVGQSAILVVAVFSTGRWAKSLCNAM